jgi:hypothetical protein
MQFLRTVGAHVAVVMFVALVLSWLDRCASAGGGGALPGAPNSTAPISLLDNRPTLALPQTSFLSHLSWLHLRVPGPTGTSVWGASLDLPFSLHVQLPHTGNQIPVPIRPTPELEIGIRSIGKATGAVAQYVTLSGMRFGAGFYFNKLGVGAPTAHQAMLTFQIPLPF